METPEKPRNNAFFILRRITKAMIVAIVSAAPSFTPAKADTPLDYMVQQVCDNGSGGHTSQDPVQCPGSARKLNIGESLPYHKWEGPSVAGSQISDSYPISDLYKRFRVIHTNFFTRRSLVPYFDAGRPETGDTGYDATGADGNYVAGIGTYDPGRGWQPFWNSPSCSMSDAWLLAPKNGSIPLAYGDQSSTINLSSPQCPSNSSFGTSYTTWNYYTGYNYQSGVALDTIKVWHFSTNSVNSDALELFFYTKQYGKTKWEAWKRATDPGFSNPNSTAVSRCGIGTNNGYAHYGSTDYTLQDCHDWSFILPVSNGDWTPGSWHVDPVFNSLNLLTNTHMRCTNASGVTQDCGGTSQCQTIAPWGRNGNTNWSYDNNFMRGNQTASCGLLFSIPSAPAGQSVYQDVYNPSLSTNYSFGVALWNPTNSAQLTANVVVYEIDSNGSEVTRHTVRQSFGNIPQFIQGTFSIDNRTSRLRFEIYLETQNLAFEMTDAWISPIP